MPEYESGSPSCSMQSPDVIDRPDSSIRSRLSPIDESSTRTGQSPIDAIDRPESSIRTGKSPIDGSDRPQSSIRIDSESNDDTASEDEGSLSNNVDVKAAAPEKKMILWTVQLAAVEKTASGLGTMNFIWATVVLLGGFALTLKAIDFWFVSIILTAEGLRILGRMGELETEAASWRPVSPSFDGRITGIKLYSATIQEFSALTCVFLSIYRLKRGHYGGNDYRNRNPALIVFYALSLAEALLILLGFLLKFFLGLSPFCQENPGRFIWKVTDDYGFHVSQCSIVRRFFYDTFSQCVNGSVFDGLKMDFVSYTLNLAQSTNDDEQLTGVLVLSSLLQNNRFASKTLRAISAKPGVVKILIEMLTWKSPQEENIRAAAAKIVSNLVQKDPNGIWMRAVTKSMDSVASLLYDSNQIEIHSRSYRIQINNYDYSFFSSLGLKILHILAKDHVSCTKIGRNTGLLRKVIAITELNLDPMDWQVSPDLKIPAIETLTSLAHKQEKVVDSIGATVLHNLFSLFVMARKNDDDDKAKKLFNAAGKALGVLSVESKHNCDIMRRIKPGSYSNMIVSLISMLEDPATFLHVARILRNLLAHADAQSLDWKEITRPAPMVEECIQFDLLKISAVLYFNRKTISCS